MISQGEGILICNSYSSRELGFYAQHPHGGSQPSGTPVLGDLMLFAALQANKQTKKKTHKHKIKNAKYFKVIGML